MAQRKSSRSSRSKSSRSKSRGRSGRKSRSQGTSQPKDALALLRADHEMVSELVDKYERGKNRADNDKKERLAQQICEELTIHAQIEEEIFYPAVREANEEAEDALADAEVEHGSIKKLIEEIEGSSPDSELFDAQIKVLGEYVKHHVKEEQTEIFRMAREADIDLKDLGHELAARKAELKGEEWEEEEEEEAA
ncbi:MAG TPA: hemerythrin domain-containing protein [Alphaproteobacteria bacterium]|jgi:hemerythrin superfamily protein|nr:hemerythrin domain-containing protein [Alphaproteobacteria bacterium]